MKPEHEILTILMEECAEVIQQASKSIRFGESAIEQELGDVVCMIDLLAKSGKVSWEAIREGELRKKQKLKKWSNLPQNLLELGDKK